MAFWVGTGQLPNDSSFLQASQSRPASRSGDTTPPFDYYGSDLVYRQTVRSDNGFASTPIPLISRSQSVPNQHNSRKYRQRSPSRRDVGPAKDRDREQAAFFVIREHSHDDYDHQRHRSDQPEVNTRLNPLQRTPFHAMERTESGISISSNDSITAPPSPESPRLLSDVAAADIVRKYMAKLPTRTPNRHSRILNTLIIPRNHSSSPAFSLDDSALESIFSAANDLFFANRLRGRVTWDWSHPDSRDSSKYSNAIVGTTALRRVRTKKGGYETLIVLSSPILRDDKYNRRLLISTFLHEMIHSFLFVVCGRKAGLDGGHTPGFREIAGMIDAWVGGQYLRLSEMDADLDSFAEDGGCSGGRPENEKTLQPHFVAEPIWVGPAGHAGHAGHHLGRPSPERHHSTPVYLQGAAASVHNQAAEVGCSHDAEGWHWQRNEGFVALNEHSH